ncbi:unnamed protein product [Paramecium sonneborni]|uniref:Uncharacterized protein n=1 Tax=Paramecium sonneborni TaxID=65129 RepID=A0A8S1L7N8_9CILI|nr:unnamed protein product [Paramecium sonneborni]
MIGMDSQNKKVEDRFLCVDCIAENPQTEYQTIQMWISNQKKFSTETERLLKVYSPFKKVRCQSSPTIQMSPKSLYLGPSFLTIQLLRELRFHNVPQAYPTSAYFDLLNGTQPPPMLYKTPQDITLSNPR